MTSFYLRTVLGLTWLTLFMASPLLAENVQIGVIAPLSGGLADRGQEIVRTVEVFQDVYLKSAKFEYQFLFEDGKNGLGNSATLAAKKFIDIDGINFLVTGTSGETIQAGMAAQKAGVVAIGVLATVPEIRRLGDYVFRTYVDIERGLRKLYSVMETRNQNFAVLSEESPFNFGIKKILTEIGKEKLIFQEDFPADTMDFKSILTRLKAKHPDAIYLNCASPKSFNPLVKQIKDMGLKQPLYTYFMPAEPQVQSALGTLLEGIVFIDTPRLTDDSGCISEFMRFYLQKYPQGPQVEFLMRTTHDALLALTDSIERVGPDPEKVKDQLHQLTIKGALGEISFDSAGDIRDLDFSINTFYHGEVKPVEDLQ